MAQPIPFQDPFNQRNNPYQQKSPNNNAANPSSFYPQQQQQPMMQQQPMGGSYPGHSTSPTGSNNNNPQQHPNFFNSISGNNPMAGYAMNQASSFLQNQSTLYLPGAMSYWQSIKYYFTVNNSFVLRKFKLLLLPFFCKDWRRVPLDNTTGTKIQFSPPTADVNAPDLYIPLMGFITYILMAGYVKGASGEFSPEVIGNVGTYCLMMQILEIGLVSFGLYLLQNNSSSVLDLVAFTSYKYVCLVINMLVHIILGNVCYYISLLYTGVAIAYFVLQSMKGSMVASSNNSSKMYLLYSIAGLQVVLIWWNGYKSD